MGIVRAIRAEAAIADQLVATRVSELRAREAEKLASRTEQGRAEEMMPDAPLTERELQLPTESFLRKTC